MMDPWDDCIFTHICHRDQPFMEINMQSSHGSYGSVDGFYLRRAISVSARHHTASVIPAGGG